MLYAVIYRYMLHEVLKEYDDPKEMFCYGEIIVINWEDTKVSMCVYVLLYIYLYCTLVLPPVEVLRLYLVYSNGLQRIHL